MLHALELTNQLAKLSALIPHIPRGILPRAQRQPRHLRRDADAALVQQANRVLVALALAAEQGVSRQPDVVEGDDAGRGGADAELLFLLRDGEPRGVLGEQEGGDAFVAERGVEVREDDEEAGFEAVGDPHLAAVEQVGAVGLLGGAGFEREGVGAGDGFGEAEGTWMEGLAFEVDFVMGLEWKMGNDIPIMFVASIGSHFFLFSSLPYFNIAVFTSVLWTSVMTLTLGSTLANSSIATIAAVKFMPAPPYSSGISMPIRPCSKHCSMISGSIFSASSISLVLGRMTSDANLATCSFIKASVSDRWDIGVGGMSDMSKGSPLVTIWRRMHVDEMARDLNNVSE